MRYSVVLDCLQNLTNREVSQAELCKILSIKQSTMSNKTRVFKPLLRLWHVSR